MAAETRISMGRCQQAANPPNIGGMEPNDDAIVLDAQLQQLRGEHRDLDEAIAQLAGTPSDDELLLRRLKKRKLLLKDRIALIERMMQPDEPA